MHAQFSLGEPECRGLFWVASRRRGADSTAASAASSTGRSGRDSDERLLSIGLNGKIVEWDTNKLLPKFVSESYGGAIWYEDAPPAAAARRHLCNMCVCDGSSLHACDGSSLRVCCAFLAFPCLFFAREVGDRMSRFSPPPSVFPFRTEPANNYILVGPTTVDEQGWLPVAEQGTHGGGLRGRHAPHL